jgi:hypothetical protein
LIPTEHSLLDDNGDGLGSRLLDMPDFAFVLDSGGGEDGFTADKVYLKDLGFPPGVPQELINRYLAVLDKITELKRSKESVEEKVYYADLEKLLLEAAQANREIRRVGGMDASEKTATNDSQTTQAQVLETRS